MRVSRNLLAGAAFLSGCAAGCSFRSLEPLLCPESDPRCDRDAALADGGARDAAPAEDARLPDPADGGCEDCADAGPGELEIYYANDAADELDSRIRLFFAIRNKGGAAIPLSELTVRYYFTTETGGAQVFECSSVIGGSFDCSSVNSRNEEVDAERTNRLIEWSFAPSAGSLEGDGAMTGTIKGLIRNEDFSDFDQSNDYSFRSGAEDLTLHDRMTLHRNGQLVWGVPP